MGIPVDLLSWHALQTIATLILINAKLLPVPAALVRIAYISMSTHIIQFLIKSSTYNTNSSIFTIVGVSCLVNHHCALNNYCKREDGNQLGTCEAVIANSGGGNKDCIHYFNVHQKRQFNLSLTPHPFPLLLKTNAKIPISRDSMESFSVTMASAT